MVSNGRLSSVIYLNLKFSIANGCKLSAAQLLAETDDFDKSIEIFEQVGKESVDNKLTKWSISRGYI